MYPWITTPGGHGEIKFRPTDMIRFRGENGDGISWTAQGHGATDDFSRGELRLAAKPLVNFLMSTVKLAGWPAVFFSTVP